MRRTDEESPTDPGYFRNHPTSSLAAIVTSYTAQSVAMAASSPELAAEAMSIANNAWYELTVRELAS